MAFLPVVLLSPITLNQDAQMLKNREKVFASLREKPMKMFEVMKRSNIVNQEACQSLLLKMRDEGPIQFNIKKGVWSAIS